VTATIKIRLVQARSVAAFGRGAGEVTQFSDSVCLPLTRTSAAQSREVTMILVMSEVVLPLAEIKKRLSEIVDGVEERHDRVVLTRHGRPAAVLVSPEELESLEETLDLLSDPRAVRDIRKAEAAIERGDIVDADALRAKYLKR
jgi:antitoxin YefM